METIDGPLAANPHRVGKALDEPFDGYHSARRGTYRIIYRVN
jgi:mRNA interferase RelE/StbE